MDDKSTTDAADSTAAKTDDDLDLSAEDNVGNDPQDATDDPQTDDADKDSKDDDLASDDSADDADSGKADDAKKTEDKAPTFDTDLEEWAEKTGHEKPETDRERKLLQDLRNSKRDFTRERQAKKTVNDLQKSIKDATPKVDTDDAIADPLEKDVQQLRADLRDERATRMQSEYFNDQGVTPEEVKVMGEILKEKADRGNLKAFEYLADAENIGDLHDLAKKRMVESVDSEVAEKVRQEERERLAKVTKSAGPSRSAHGNPPPSKEDELTKLWKSDD